jgi:signal transduction histidine kinase
VTVIDERKVDERKLDERKLDERKLDERKVDDLTPSPSLEKPFRLAKYFSTVAIAVIFATCLILAAFMSRRAEEMIQERVVEDTIMIMDNLNFQLYNNFLRPIYETGADGRLSQPEAYEYLNSVIQNTIHGFDISRVAIYDATYGLMIYSSDSAEPVIALKPVSDSGGRIPDGEFASPLSAYLEAVSRFFLKPIEEILRQGTAGPRFWRPPGASGRAAYLNYLKERAVIVQEGGGYLLGSFFPRGRFSMRCFKAMENYVSPEISGVLEITRDLTPEYEQIASMQYTALATAVCTSLALTIILRIVVARGEVIINQKNAEKAALSERLNQAERLVNLGRMVATVSHEIRNPLGVINSSADFLAQGLKESPKMARLAEAIVDESERLSSIVTDFLDFARPQAPVFAPMILEELLEEIFVLLEVQMGRAGVELRAELRDKPSPINADRALMHQALVNVLVNAIQAMPEGGLMTVKTSVETSADTGYLALTISDTGEGLSPEVAQNLFTPFHTTKVKGSGLGLVLVRNIVESHGGRIDLTNAPGEGEEDHGLIVTIKLPLPGFEPGHR